MSTSHPYPPPGAFRKRLCLPCADKLERSGYLTNPEKDSAARGICELCKQAKTVTRVYRYTLSCETRAKLHQN